MYIGTVQINCTQLTNGPPSAFTAAQLSSLTTSVFVDCMSILGSSTNTYTTEQISALATVANVFKIIILLMYF